MQAARLLDRLARRVADGPEYTAALPANKDGAHAALAVAKEAQRVERVRPTLS